MTDHSPYARAAGLPLRDAAYLLWKAKGYLDDEEGLVPPPLKAPSDLFKPGGLAAALRMVAAKINHERENAADGVTFKRLRKAHPECSVSEARAAIRAAVKFDLDCGRCFSYASPSYLDDCARAVKLAMAENPGFTEATYDAAVQRLAADMR